MESGQKVLLKMEFDATIGDLWSFGCKDTRRACEQECRAIRGSSHFSVCLYRFNLLVCIDEPLVNGRLQTYSFQKEHCFVLKTLAFGFRPFLFRRGGRAVCSFHLISDREALADWRSKQKVGRTRPGAVLRHATNAGNARGVSAAGKTGCRKWGSKLIDVLPFI